MQREKVVYFLGAGFSAPLGLPVMSNFLVKSKDQYFTDTTEFKHFDEVFKTIREMSFVKNYFKTDLFNIEDILSILDMQYHLGRPTVERTTFIQFIKDVIDHYTPFVRFDKDTWWLERFFGTEPGSFYGVFVATLLGHCFGLQSPSGPPVYLAFAEDHGGPPKQIEYSVVSLNYDLVLESHAHSIHDKLGGGRHFYSEEQPNDAISVTYLAKLHGSVDGSIVPPTWNKTLADADISKAWRLAFKLLSEANHIRVIGYSLPTNDAYVKFLFRSAIMEASHLKTFDVLCLDPDMQVKKRYDDFVDFRDYRFKSASVKKYLESHTQAYHETWPDPLAFDQLEDSHARFFAN